MAWSVDGIRAKLDRCDANLESFGEELTSYVRTNPHKITPEFDPESEWHHVFIDPDPPPTIFGLIIGEAVHNLRSALDHLAWQLANLDGAPPQPDRVQFPIFSDAPKDFFEHPCVGGMRLEHKTVLEQLQPYNAGHGQTALEQLAWLSNTDKHRLLHTTASNAEEFVPHFLKARAGYVIERSEFGYSGLMEGRTQIGRLLVTPTNADLQVDMQIAPSVGISFGEPGSPVYGFYADGLLKVLKESAEGIVTVFDRPGASGVPPWP